MASANTEDRLDNSWLNQCASYGSDNVVLSDWISTLQSTTFRVEVRELSSSETNNQMITKRIFEEMTSFKSYLCSLGVVDLRLRAITILRLTGELVKVLGARYSMDYETWTSRFQSSDREYFAAPLPEKGPSHFSHFNLACVDFYRSTALTPPEYLHGRKITRTLRLMKLLERPQEVTKYHRMYVIRRISGHLRWDSNVWTFLYFCDPSENLERAAYVSDIPGCSMAGLDQWLSNAVNNECPTDYLDVTCRDGFFLIVKILRDIKSSWKLLLSEMEDFLEAINERFTDKEFMAAGPYLHRQFLLNLDLFQKDLFYHRRYISYLMDGNPDRNRHIVPELCGTDLAQEDKALAVLDLRLKAIRTRTTTVLGHVLNITTIEQARLSADLLQLQRQDAQIAFQQGESVKRLTLLNMIYLPPSFIAAVYGMNTVTTQNTQIWTFVVIAILLTSVTMLVASSSRKFWDCRKSRHP